MKIVIALCTSLFLLSSGPRPASAAPVLAAAVQDGGGGGEESAPLYGDPELVPGLIAAAVARAKQENKRVLIQWGGEWCGWCHLLHKAFTENAELARELLYEYEVVYANIGRFDRNLELAASLGADLHANGVPYLTVLDGAGKPIANHETGSFEREDAGDGLQHDPAKLLAFLDEHQAAYLEAQAIVDEALALAARSERRVLLTFGAPWCPWCHKLEDWLALPEVARVLAVDFAVAKIDTDRTIGGAEVLERYRKGRDGGIPWFVFLDAAGAELASSNGPDGNLGCPWTEAEKAVFTAILRKVTTRITAEEIATIVAKLGPQEPPEEGGGGARERRDL